MIPRKRQVLSDFEKIKLIENGIIRALDLTFVQELQMDKAIEVTFRENKKWTYSSRGFVSLTLVHIIRNWRLLLTLVDVKKPASKEDFKKVVIASLMLEDKEVPYKNLPKGYPQEREFYEKLAKYKKIRKIAQSYPDWLDEEGEKQLKSRWSTVAKSLNERPAIYLRCNTIKTDPITLQGLLRDAHIEAEYIKGTKAALTVPSTARIFRTEEFANGFFEIQDLSSQMVSEYLSPEPGSRVIDGCAGAGGKTLHLASLMQNKGKIIAMDTSEHRLAEAKKRMKRAGVGIVEIRHIDSSKVIKRLQDSADYVLLDMPCSGTGVIRKNPDTKWRLTEEVLRELEKTQARLLVDYSKMVKPGGVVVYAVCSIFPSEGEKQVEDFVIANSDKWKIEKSQRIWPEEQDCDGFYMARLKRLS